MRVIKTSDEINGLTINIIEINGNSSSSIYLYYDDWSTCYLANLLVDMNHRNKGIGLKMIETQEKVAKLCKIKNLTLMVEKDSWIHDWYERLGYTDVKTDQNNIWMTKSIT